MTKITITYINRTERVSAKNNKPYTSLSLKATEFGEKYLSGFESKETANWKIGDVVEVNISEVVKDGKTYLNFKLPEVEDKFEVRFAKIEFSIANLHRKIGEIVAEVKRLNPSSNLTSAGTEVPNFVPNTPAEAENFGKKMEAYEKKTEDQSLEESLEAEYARM